MNIGMNFMDLHNHTVWSDGVNSIKEVIENAIKYNITVIGITDHFNTNKCPSIKPKEIEGYISEIQYLKKLYEDKIKVYAGIEICCTPFPQSLENLPFDKLNQLDFVLLEYLDRLSSDIKVDDINKNIEKLQCEVGLAHTDLFRLAAIHSQDGGLNFILDFLSKNNLFWEINSNSAYESFDDIIYYNDDEDIQNLFEMLKKRKIRVSASSDTHSICDFEFGRLIEANRIANIINEGHTNQ
jgi:histidinol phosphatase-like PHP family hydrolase